MSGATAISPSAAFLVLVQFLARSFAAGEASLASVAMLESFDAQHRGWGMGALIGMAGAGAGFGLALLGYIDVLPFGWRFLYVVGTVPLLATAWLRRSLKETKVFEAHQTAQIPAVYG